MDTACIEWTGPVGHNGYGKAHRGGRFRIAHRWAWEQTNGPIPPGVLLLHSCDNRLCVNLEHLRLGTQRENMAEAKAKGRIATGERHGRSRLTDDQAAEIRDTPRYRGVNRDLAARFGVAQSTISQIRSGVLRRA